MSDSDWEDLKKHAQLKEAQKEYDELTETLCDQYSPVLQHLIDAGLLRVVDGEGRRQVIDLMHSDDGILLIQSDEEEEITPAILEMEVN